MNQEGILLQRPNYPLPVKYPANKGVKIAGNSLYSDSHSRSTCYAVENTQPYHTWKGNYLLKFTMGHPSGMDKLLCTLE